MRVRREAAILTRVRQEGLLHAHSRLRQPWSNCVACRLPATRPLCATIPFRRPAGFLLGLASDGLLLNCMVPASRSHHAGWLNASRMPADRGRLARARGLQPEAGRQTDCLPA